MKEEHKQTHPIDWFRHASPYINKHRGRTFVLAFGGEALTDAQFPHLIHDITLLSHLGIRLVLVHGTRTQIDQEMAKLDLEPLYHKGLRITDNTALELAKRISGAVRIEIEALLSMGLPNTPMSGARLSVVSGNFVIARPLGIHDGIDYCHTGEVRRIEVDALKSQLEGGNLVLLSSLGYSPTGEVFNLRFEDVAAEVAVALHAQKLLYLTEAGGLTDRRNQLIRELNTREAEKLLEDTNTATSQLLLKNAIHSCRRGVERVHLINRLDKDALLSELFTRDGSGTLISGAIYEDLRTATIDDVGGLLELITPLEQNGTLIPRTREQLELEIDHFTVIERDGAIIACAALHPIDDDYGELACVATHPDYTGSGRAETIIEHIQKKAREQNLTKLLVLTTRTSHWFQERGFLPVEIDKLPLKKRALYNYQRNSKVFIKKINTK